MTEISEDDDHLVCVRAQVMTRDDSSGGWVPLGGGGLSNVSVRNKPRPQACPTLGQSSKPKHDYLIYGKRISDNSDNQADNHATTSILSRGSLPTPEKSSPFRWRKVVLSCTIKKDFEYNKVMPTFHHWKTGDKKFGLTFQAAADARAFDRGVRLAVEDLLDGYVDTSPTTLLRKPSIDPEDEVFMTLELPQDPKDSRSSSDSSTGSRGKEIMHTTSYIGRDKALVEPRQPAFTPQKGSENYPYVQLTAVHEYIYPSDESPHLTSKPKPMFLTREAPSPPDDLKKTSTLPLTQLHHHPHHYPKKNSPSPDQQRQRRCRHCNKMFSLDANPRGGCEYAPDPVESAINAITCVSCVDCVMYHCASDAEGEYAQNPCSCANDDTCTRRWLCLSFLSVFLPCLWMYPPLKTCHFCGIKSGLCGGRHRESDM